MDPASTFSTPPAPDCLAGAELSVWATPPLEEEDLEPPLLLKSLSFSSMDFWGTALGGASAGGAALEELSFSCLTVSMAEGLEVEEFLELIDLLLQGLLLALGWGMAEEEAEDEGMRAEVEEQMLVVTEDDGACSVITEGCEVTPSEDSLLE